MEEPTIPVVNKSQRAIWAGNTLLEPHGVHRLPISAFGEFGYLKDLWWDWSGFKDNYRAKADDGRPYFDFYCPLSQVDGYGRHALWIYEGFGESAVVNLRDVEWVDHIYLDPKYKQLVSENSLKMPAKVRLIMTLPYDPHLHAAQVGQTNIVISQFETDRVPKKHVENINRCDHLIITSSYQEAVMKNCGVKVPISCLTPGVDTRLFAYYERPKTETFNVLVLGALTSRKNPRGAVEIFQKASKGHPAWRLTIKTRLANETDDLMKFLGFDVEYEYPMGEKEAARKEGREPRLRPKIEQPFTAQAPLDPRILLIVRDDHPLRVNEFYRQHDCLLWPSKGEGCGLPPLEAMATGMEVVSSNNSGMADFVKDDVAWVIKNAGMEPAGWPFREDGFSQTYVETYGDVGRWWLPDLDHGAKQLEACYEAWRKGKGKGKRASEIVHRDHDLQAQSHSVLAVVAPYCGVEIRSWT